MMSNPAFPASHPRWPDVPACHGWLSLDRRGQWALRGERVTHPGFIRFLNAHYTSDDAGNWLVENGPQKVYVTLDYTPLVLRLGADGGITDHTGAAAGAVLAAHLDDEGNALLHIARGVGVVDDRDLAAFLAACRRADGGPADDADLVAVMEGGDPGLCWGALPLQPIARAAVPGRFGFRPQPAA
jgi:hypothetical protein